MLTAAVILSLLVGWMGGGRLSRWEEARIHWIFLPIAALLIQRIAVAWVPWPKTGSGFWGPALLLLSYLTLGLFLLRNRRRRRTALCAGAGLLFNLAVIAANGWRRSAPRLLSGSPPWDSRLFLPEPSPCTPWPVRRPDFSF